jgi:hypothetical protein
METDMNRQQRRAQTAQRRKFEVGTIIHAQAFTGSDGFHYWFEPPEGWTTKDGMPEDVEIHGPFKTAAEVDQNQRLVLLGPQCTVTEGGEITTTQLNALAEKLGATEH